MGREAHFYWSEEAWMMVEASKIEFWGQAEAGAGDVLGG